MLCCTFLSSIKTLTVIDPITLDPIYIYYDINCRYYNHFMNLLEEKDIPLGHRIIPVIGEMHVYGHERLCQVTLNPKMTPGTGMCEGEAGERLWSRSGKFHHIVKEQSPDNRREQLDDHFLHEYTLKDAGISRELKRKEVEAKEGLQV